MPFRSRSITEDPKGYQVRIGICTQDFSRVYDLVRILHERGLDFSLLSADEIYDGKLDAVIVEGPSPRFSGIRPPFVRPLMDPSMTVDRVLAVAWGVFRPGRMVLGIDPGLRTGLALVADGIVIETRITMEPSNIPLFLRQSVVALRPRGRLVRIGNGDPQRRDAIIEELKPSNTRIEVVDESSTSVEPRRTHEDAAVRIARLKGKLFVTGLANLENDE